MQRLKGLCNKITGSGVFRFMAKPLLCLALVIGILMAGIPAAVHASDDVLDTTWYTLSSAASGWLSDALAQGTDVGFIPGGSVGGVLGYCDEANTSGVIIDLIQSTISSSSATYSYDALSNMGTEFINYGNYGRSLRAIGLDDTSSMSDNMLRSLAGNLLLGLYSMSTFVNQMFGFVVDFLRKINPYRLFTFNGGPLVSFGGDGIEKMTMSDGQTMAGYMNNLLAFLRDNFAWLIIIPASVTFLIWALFLSNRNKGYEIKKFLWRIAIIFFSVPIMGSIYTTTLDWIDAEIDPKNGTPSAKIVASMLVDFEAWAQSGLSVSGPGIRVGNINDPDSGAIQDENLPTIRQVCLKINNMACPNLPTSIGGNADDASSWNKEISGASDNNDMGDVDVSSYIRGLCVRYARGDKYTPSDYRGWWTSLYATPFKGEPIEQTVEDTDTLLDWTSNGASTYLTSDPSGLWSGGGDKPWLGMSPMSVYNYLSTKFSDSGITIYSNEKASSGFVRDFHYSVNLVGGNGLVSFLIYLNGATMLSILILLAVGYGGGIIIHSVMRTFKVITSIPMATLGSLRYGAKLIGNTIMMLAEVVVSLFMYALAVSLLYGSMDLVDIFFNNLAGGTIDGSIAQTLVMVVEYVLSIVLYIWLGIMLLRYRKKAVKAIDEMICGFINRLVPGANADDMMDKDKPNKLANMAKGAAGAAAGTMAAGAISNALNGGTKDAKPGDSATGESTNGGGGDGGSGGSGGDGAEVSVNNSSVNNASDDDMVYKEEDAGGDGFDNETGEDEAGKDLAEAESLDDADSGHGIEEDEDGVDGDEDGDNVPEGDEDEVESAAEGDAADSPEGGADAAADGAASSANATANSKASAEKAQAALAKSEQQKQALEKALGMSGDKASAASGAAAGKPVDHKAAASEYQKALATADGGKGSGPSAEVKAVTSATKAAQDKKGAALSPAESAAAQRAASAVRNGLANSGVANAAAKGVSPVSTSQMAGIEKAAQQAAKAANGGKLSAAQADAAKSIAGRTAKEAYAASSVTATTNAAAEAGASAALNGAPLSATDKAMAAQAANEVRAAAQRATSPAGMAESAALAAATAANGGRPLTSSQVSAVKNAAAQATESVQSAALAGAESAKGGPLSNAEIANIKEGCGVEAAQQAALNAVEKCMETPLNEAQRGALMTAAKSHANGIMADNSQVKQAERAASKAASVVGQAHGAGRMGKKAYAQMMGGVRSGAQQAVANAQPANIAARSAVEAANSVRAMNNQAPLSANQVNQVANMAMQSAGVADAYGGTPMQQYQEYVSDSMSVQAMTNNAREMASRMNSDQYEGMNYAEQAQAMRSQTQQNYQQIEALKSQLAAKGYSQEQINAIARNENAVARGEGPSGPAVVNQQSGHVDIRSEAIKAGIAGAMMGSGVSGAQFAGGAMMNDSMTRIIKNGRGNKRTLGDPEDNDTL